MQIKRPQKLSLISCILYITFSSHIQEYKKYTKDFEIAKVTNALHQKKIKLLVRGGSDDLRVWALDDQHYGAGLRDGGGGVIDANAVRLMRRPVLALAECRAVGSASAQRALGERFPIAIGALFVLVRLGAGLQTARRLQ